MEIKRPGWKLEYFRGKNHRHYWHMKASNGKTVFQCSEGDGFLSRAAACKNFSSARRSLQDGNYKIVG